MAPRHVEPVIAYGLAGGVVACVAGGVSAKRMPRLIAAGTIEPWFSSANSMNFEATPLPTTGLSEFFHEQRLRAKR